MKMIPFRALLVGMVMSLVFIYMSIYGYNRVGNLEVPATQFSSLAIVFSLLLSVLINPILKFIRVRPFSISEIIIVAIMCIAPAGMAGYGFIFQQISLSGNLHVPKTEYRYEDHLTPHVQEKLYMNFDTEEKWKDYHSGIRIKDQQAFPVFIPRDDDIIGFPRQLYRYFFSGNPDKLSLMGDVPWGEWSSTLVYWLLFVGIIFLLFYSLNELLFKQWYDNEKLVFPHAEVISALIVAEKDGEIPKVYKDVVFWAGFSLAFVFVFYNAVLNAGWIHGLEKLDYINNIDSFLEGTSLEAVTPKFNLMIFFVVIGLAFFLPAEITFSIWSFFLFMMLQVIVAVQLGYGENMQSFASNWLERSSFMTAQGGGAAIVFGIFCLYKVRHNLFSFIYTFTFPKGLKNFNSEEIKKSSGASFCFFLASSGLILFFVWAKVDIFTSILIYLSILLMTITTVRMVSEGGLISFQFWFGPYHIIQNLGLLKLTSIFKAGSIAASLPIFSSLFIEMKTFIAPTMMTCRNLAARGKIKKGIFPLSLFLAIGLCLVFGTMLSLSMLYDNGVQNMNPWFFGQFSSEIYTTANRMVSHASGAEFNLSIFNWMLVGALSMGGIIFGRQYFFWLPHPIGLLMFVNPLTRWYWFSFLIAWLFKVFAVKYCSAKGYMRVKYFFIGLLLGELVLVALSGLGAFTDNFQFGIMLDRNG